MSRCRWPTRTWSKRQPLLIRDLQGWTFLKDLCTSANLSEKSMCPFWQLIFFRANKHHQLPLKECHESSVNHAHDQTLTLSSSGTTWYHPSSSIFHYSSPKAPHVYSLWIDQGTQMCRDQRFLRCRLNYVRLATSVDTKPRWRLWLKTAREITVHVSVDRSLKSPTLPTHVSKHLQGLQCLTVYLLTLKI